MLPILTVTASSADGFFPRNPKDGNQAFELVPIMLNIIWRRSGILLSFCPKAGPYCAMGLLLPINQNQALFFAWHDLRGWHPFCLPNLQDGAVEFRQHFFRPKWRERIIR
jgi:hypothetical protein